MSIPPGVLAAMYRKQRESLGFPSALPPQEGVPDFPVDPGMNVPQVQELRGVRGVQVEEMGMQQRDERMRQWAAQKRRESTEKSDPYRRLHETVKLMRQNPDLLPEYQAYQERQEREVSAPLSFAQWLQRKKASLQAGEPSWGSKPKGMTAQQMNAALQKGRFDQPRLLGFHGERDTVSPKWR